MLRSLLFIYLLHILAPVSKQKHARCTDLSSLLCPFSSLQVLFFFQFFYIITRGFPLGGWLAKVMLRFGPKMHKVLFCPSIQAVSYSPDSTWQPCLWCLCERRVLIAWKLIKENLDRTSHFWGVWLQHIGVTSQVLFCCPNSGEKEPLFLGDVKPRGCLRLGKDLEALWLSNPLPTSPLASLWIWGHL